MQHLDFASNVVGLGPFGLAVFRSWPSPAFCTKGLRHPDVGKKFEGFWVVAWSQKLF